MKDNCDGVRMINTHKPPENATVKRYGKPQKHYSKGKKPVIKDHIW